MFYLLQRLKVTEAHLAVLDQKTRQNVDVGEVKSLLRKEIPNLRHLLSPDHGKTIRPGSRKAGKAQAKRPKPLPA